jgi:hypothetical protein
VIDDVSEDLACAGDIVNADPVRSQVGYAPRHLYEWNARAA